VVAVRNVAFEVRRGEVLGLLGPNASGKTTLLRLITGYLSPTAGRLLVDGHDTVRTPQEARRRIGYVPEGLPLYGHMRVREFLTFLARLRGVPGPRVRASVDMAAERLHVTPLMAAPIHTLSRGYRQRVAIAQALVHRPQVLVLDEPTNGLDPRQIIDTRTLIKELAGEHTVLLSSHSLTEVEKIANRVAILLNGELLAVRPLTQTPDLEALFLSLT
jgi:ABC-2 type transport system ATP-binding protein